MDEVLEMLGFGKWLISLVVRERGLEPLREIPLDPKSSASTSSATLAGRLPENRHLPFDKLLENVEHRSFNYVKAFREGQAFVHIHPASA